MASEVLVRCGSLIEIFLLAPILETSLVEGVPSSSLALYKISL